MLLREVIEDVRAGKDLSSAFGRWERIFSDVYISMIKAGEASGQLDDILCRLADYMEASERLRRDIKSAMTYPVASLVLIFGITGFLVKHSEAIQCLNALGFNIQGIVEIINS